MCFSRNEDNILKREVILSETQHARTLDNHPHQQQRFKRGRIYLSMVHALTLFTFSTIIYESLFPGT